MLLMRLACVIFALQQWATPIIRPIHQLDVHTFRRGIDARHRGTVEFRGIAGRITLTEVCAAAEQDMMRTPMQQRLWQVSIGWCHLARFLAFGFLAAGLAAALALGAFAGFSIAAFSATGFATLVAFAGLPVPPLATLAAIIATASSSVGLPGL